MQAKFTEKEQDWQSEATRYWFAVDGAEYAVVESTNEAPAIIDAAGRDVPSWKADELRPLLIVTDEMRAA